MNSKSFSFLIILLLTIVVFSQTTTIDFTTSGTGYTISDNIVTISTDGTYELTGTFTDKKIIVSSSSTLNFNTFSLINTGALTPIIISSNKEVEFILTETSTLQDSTTNEKNGTIYLESGASLKISGAGTLNIIPYKLMAINGTEGTSLTVNDGASISIASENNNIGGIYLRNGITFNNAVYTYSCPNGAYHAIDSESSIKIIKGKYNIISGNGKGIQTEKYLYLGEEDGNNSDLILSIITSDEGIEAKGIEIYSGTITIDANEDGINAASSDNDCDETVKCSGNCACYVKFSGGDLILTSNEDGIDSNGDITISGGNIVIFAAANTEDQPIDQDGLLSITGGNIIAAGSAQMEGGVSATTTQTAKIYSGTINKGDTLVIADGGEELKSLTTPKAASYIYFNFPTAFNVKLNNNEITLSEPSQNQGNFDDKGGPLDPNGPDGRGPPGNNDNNDNNNNDYYINLSKYFLILGIILM